MTILRAVRKGGSGGTEEPGRRVKLNANSDICGSRTVAKRKKAVGAIVKLPTVERQRPEISLSLAIANEHG